MLSLREVQRRLTAQMRTLDWYSKGGREKMVFMPGDPMMGGDVEVDVKRLHRKLREIRDEDQRSQALEYMCAAAVKDAQKRAFIPWEYAESAIRASLWPASFNQGATLESPEPFDAYALVPLIESQGIVRSIHWSELNNWGGPDPVLRAAAHNLTLAPLPDRDYYGGGVIVLQGERNSLPAISWLWILQDMRESLRLPDEFLAWAPNREMLGICPLPKDQDTLDSFRHEMFKNQDDDLPVRCFRYLPGRTERVSCDQGSPIPQR